MASNQHNAAAERSAHVTRGGQEERTGRSSIIELPNGASILRAVHVRNKVIEWLARKRKAERLRATEALDALMVLYEKVTVHGDVDEAMARARRVLEENDLVREPYRSADRGGRAGRLSRSLL